jgi:hypothetical protein
MIPLWVRNLPETFSKNNFVLPLSIWWLFLITGMCVNTIGHYNGFRMSFFCRCSPWLLPVAIPLF